MTDEAPRVRRFFVDVDKKNVEDLKNRLKHTRFPDQLAGAGWDYGSELTFMKGLIEYWTHTYSWPKQQEWLNSHFSHFKIMVNGIDLHFTHKPHADSDAIPLLLIHGWPGSFIEFQKIIPKLAANRPGQPNYHIVAPSLPGYGFSSSPVDPGFGLEQMADTLNELMVQLGYSKYVAQGGDWGAFISFFLGSKHAGHCQAIHTNLPYASPKMWKPWHAAQVANSWLPFLNKVPLALTQRELDGIASTAHFIERGTGYQAIQKTKPQTLGYGLNDSPIGLCAWICEKFHGWSDCHGDIYSRFSKDELLTNVCLYWFNGCITSSMRLYYESLAQRDQMLKLYYCKVPTAAADFPKDLYHAPRAWIEQQYNLKQYSMFDSGGHFAAMEEPDLLVEDMNKLFKTIKL
ncbi:hypothetical protein WJX84_005225 [Apatococcus fuscideae]|uniref:Epoxide hydrolase N-terminal domain-containing protein n=1 Tax=Apatococcus fuscideae TaxID=2026836 RepID=A0AAW1SUK9_9CHLO